MTAPRRHDRGFVLLAVLILVGLIAVIGASYGRHVLVDSQGSSAAPAAMRSGGAVDSGLQFARQMLRTGRPGSATLTDGSATAAISVADLGLAHSRVELQSLDSQGLGATLLCEVARTPAPLGGGPDDLPRVQAATVAALMANAAVPKTFISGLTTLQDVDLDGLIVIQSGAVLTVSGVALRGSIVSEATLGSLDYGPYDVLTAPTLLIAGDLRVTPRAELPGVALVLPDGIVTQTVASSRLQLEGDVVAHTLVLTGRGSLDGNVATAAVASIAATIQRPRFGRAPRAWAAGLDLGEASTVLFLAPLARVQGPADVPAILAFDFDDP